MVATFRTSISYDRSSLMENKLHLFITSKPNHWSEWSIHRNKCDTIRSIISTLLHPNIIGSDTDYKNRLLRKKHIQKITNAMHDFDESNQSQSISSLLIHKKQSKVKSQQYLQEKALQSVILLIHIHLFMLFRNSNIP
eukprot:581430_1